VRSTKKSFAARGKFSARKWIGKEVYFFNLQAKAIALHDEKIKTCSRSKDGNLYQY
jgi:hypothetical protein